MGYMLHVVMMYYSFFIDLLILNIILAVLSVTGMEGSLFLVSSIFLSISSQDEQT